MNFWFDYVKIIDFYIFCNCNERKFLIYRWFSNSCCDSHLWMSRLKFSFHWSEYITFSSCSDWHSYKLINILTILLSDIIIIVSNHLDLIILYVNIVFHVSTTPSLISEKQRLRISVASRITKRLRSLHWRRKTRVIC